MRDANQRQGDDEKREQNSFEIHHGLVSKVASDEKA